MEKVTLTFGIQNQVTLIVRISIDVIAPACIVVDIHVAVLLALDVAYLHALCDANVDRLVDTLLVLVGFENLVIVVAEVHTGLPTPSVANLPVVTHGEFHTLVADACTVERRALTVLSADYNVCVVETGVVVSDVDVEGIVEELGLNTGLETLHGLRLRSEGVVFASRCTASYRV